MLGTALDGRGVQRFESSLARRLLPVSAARAYAPSAQSGPGARPGGYAARFPCTSMGLRRRCSHSSPLALAPRRPGGGAAPARAAAASKVVLARNRRGNGLSRAQASLSTAAAPPVKGAFRIEPRAPASPAQPRAGPRSERAVGVGRERGQAVSARPPCT